MTINRGLIDIIKGFIAKDARFRPGERHFFAKESGGIVVLEGSVDSLADKRRIEDIARNLGGVQSVDNRLTVTPSFTVDDEDIARKVLNAFVQDRAIDETTISISVSDGIVSLCGQAPGFASKLYAGVVTWWVPGVRDVINLLVLSMPEEDTDAGITEVVRAALDKDPLVDSVGLSVYTEHGVVSLRGAVFGEEERDAAEDDAWFVLGVRDVDNRIKVVPSQSPRIEPRDL